MGALGRLAERGFTPRNVRWLGTITAITMFLVYALGTLVTTTASGHGCGNSWPLCHGQFIPAFAVHTAIEFTHRVATALVTPLILLLAAGVLWLWRSRLEFRILAPVMVVALFAEAGLGAALVLAKSSALLLAIHFGTSLVLFTSVLLIALMVNELGSFDALRDRPVPNGFRLLVFGLAIYTYVVGYLGAYMRLRGVELACRQWPTCNQGSFFPTTPGAAIVFVHRLAALLLLAGTLWLFLWARRLRRGRPDLYRGSQWALGLVILQALVGAIVVFSMVAEYSQMLHAGLVALLFGTLSYVCLHTLRRPAQQKAAQPRAALDASATSASATASGR